MLQRRHTRVEQKEREVTKGHTYHFHKVHVPVPRCSVSQHEPIVRFWALHSLGCPSFRRIEGQVVGLHVSKHLHPRRKRPTIRNNDRVAPWPQVDGDDVRPTAHGRIDVELPGSRLGIQRNIEMKQLSISIRFQVEDLSS